MTSPVTSAAHDGADLLRSAGLTDLVDARSEAMRTNARPGVAVESRRPRDPSASVAEAVYQSEDPLLGDAAPAHVRKTETPRDRLIAVMKASGATDRAIAESLQITTATVANTCRQAHIRRLINKIIMEEGRDTVTTVINGALVDSIYKVIDIMNDPNSGPRTQLSAASLIQDRAMGKPAQHVNVRTGKLDTDPEALDRQLAEVEARILHLQGATKLN